MKREKSGHFCILLDTPMPRRRSAHLGFEFCLGELEPKFSKFFGSPRCSNALPRRSNAPSRLTCKSCFGSSLPLILTRLMRILISE